jgi:hypothetical protein
VVLWKGPPSHSLRRKRFVMGKTSKYIYGVINSGTEEFFELGEIVSFEDIYPFKGTAEVVNSSRTANRAYTISFRDIAAVVKDSEIVDYSHITKETLARVLVSHQQLIEKVMTKHTIIPMKLGTFAESCKEVEQILARGYRTIKDIFERVQNAIEIDVVATLNDFNSFLQEVSEEEEIRTLKQTLLSKKGSVTADEQMRAGMLVKKHLDERKADYAGQMQTALRKVSDGFKAHDLMDDKMVLNTAFLLNRDRQKDFERTVEDINNEFEEKLNFRCVGPLPPYSFYTLEVRKPHFEEVDWAKKQLGLTNDFVTAEDIKRAHRKSALTCHPDKNPDVQDIEKKFDEMTKAYKILLDYYRASNQAEHNQSCCLSKESFIEDAVLVTTAG